MGRAILAGIIGYIVMSVVIMIVFSIAFVALGTEGSYKPDSWDVSMTWLIMSFVVGIIAAIAGGYVCALIAEKGSIAPIVLAGVVLILGLAMAIPAMNADPPTEPRPAEVSIVDAATKARQPTIVYFLNPFIGAVGVLIGGALRKK